MLTPPCAVATIYGLAANWLLDGLVVVGDFEGYLHWMDHTDGRLIARTRVGSDPITTGLQVYNNVLYVQGDGGELAAVRLP